MESATVDVISSPATAVVALDPIRARLLAELREPHSASALARSLDLPRQRINYHLRQLQDHGLVTGAGERRWGGLTERLLVATAEAFVIAPAAMGPAAVDRTERSDRLSASYLVSLAARLVSEVGILLRRSRETGRPAETFALDTEITVASPSARADFARDLAAAVTEVVARYHDESSPGGRRHRLVVGAHPIPTPDPTTQETSA